MTANRDTLREGMVCSDCGKPFDCEGEPFVLTCDDCIRVEGKRLAEEAANFRQPAPAPIPVRKRFYLTECEHCGWVGSSEHCGNGGGPIADDIVCPACCASMCGDAPSEADTAKHGEAVYQRILAAEARADRLSAEVEALRAALKAACSELEEVVSFTRDENCSLREPEVASIQCVLRVARTALARTALARAAVKAETEGAADV